MNTNKLMICIQITIAIGVLVGLYLIQSIDEIFSEEVIDKAVLADYVFFGIVLFLIISSVLIILGVYLEEKEKSNEN